MPNTARLTGPDSERYPVNTCQRITFLKEALDILQSKELSLTADTSIDRKQAADSIAELLIVLNF